MVFSTMTVFSLVARGETRGARLVSRSREFNTVARGIAAALLCVLGATSRGFTDEIRKWRDAQGNLHYSVTGSGSTPAAQDQELPVLHGRDASPEELFSVSVSLRRREIEKKLKAEAGSLQSIQAEVKAKEGSAFSAWVPEAVGNSLQAKASLDAQRDAYLAMSQFEQEKAEKLRKLRRRERAQLKEIVGTWKEFEALDAEVTVHYGATPSWWRKRLDCKGCPTLAEAERSLNGERATPTPADTVGATAKKAGEDDDGDDDEGWEKAWE
jgi:hypothetical protein